MQLNAVDSSTMTVYATDSRGNSTQVSKNVSYKDYSEVSIKAVTAVRSNNGVGQEVLLSLNGTFWNQSFGKETNNITKVSYNFKETTVNNYDSENETDLTATISNNNFACTNINIKGDLEAEGFEVSKSFNIIVTVKDKLSTKTYEIVLGSGTPAIAIYKDRIAIGQKYDTTLGKRLQINGETYAHSSSGDMMYYAKRTDTDVEIGFGVGAGGINHGLYSKVLEKWLVYGDKNNVYLNGSSERVLSRGKIEAESGTTKTAFEGISMQEAYNNGYPSNFGNILNLRGKDATGCSQLFLGWEGSSARGSIRYRSMRDNGNNWSSWGRIYTETGLYINDAGTNGTVTLSESAANFAYIEIYGHTNSGQSTYTKLFNANNKTFNLVGGYLAASTIWQDIEARYKINGTTISKEYEYYINTTSNGSTNIGQQGNNVFIDRVIGLR